MSCEATRDLMIDKLDGTLPPEREGSFAAHLASCAACREELEALREAEQAARSLPRVRAPDDFLDRLRAKLEAEAPPLVRPASAAAPAATGARPGAAARARVIRVPRTLAAVAALLVIAAGISLVVWPEGDLRLPLSDLRGEREPSARTAAEAEAKSLRVIVERQLARERADPTTRPEPETGELVRRAVRSTNEAEDEGAGENEAAPAAGLSLSLADAARAPVSAGGEPMEVVTIQAFASEADVAWQRASETIARVTAPPDSSRRRSRETFVPPGPAPALPLPPAPANVAQAGLPRLVVEVTEAELAAIIDGLRRVPGIRLGDVPPRLREGAFESLSGGPYDEDQSKKAPEPASELARKERAAPVTQTARAPPGNEATIRLVIEFAREEASEPPGASAR